MASQRWKGHLWQHDLVISQPQTGRFPGTGVIHVTGWEPNETDLLWADALASTTGVVVATLFQIPNQPLWGHQEDDLIAHTFEQFLDSGDASWPLLGPMVKSVYRAMDVVQAHDPAIERFVVTGASKRGWTTWLSACHGDSRIVGIAPMVFDFLKMPEQLAKQQRDWAGLSPMIQDYTSRSLEDTVETDNGQRLVELVDPARCLGGLHAPVLAVFGSNDPYWTIDAQTLYWSEVPLPRAMVMVPNMGHGWGSTEYWTPTLSTFVQACSTGEALPHVEHTVLDDGLRIRADATLGTVTAWCADSETRHFDESEWREVPVERETSGAGVQVRLTQTPRFQAVFLSLGFVGSAGPYWLSSPVKVLDPWE